MSNISYQIIPLHDVCNSQKGFLNQIYALWDETFGHVAAQSGVILNHDDFFRCHAAGVLIFNNEIVGFNLFTVFDLQLDAHRNHNYFKKLDPQFVRSVTKQSGKVMTMEYFTLAPLWRKNSQEIPWGEILTGLGLYHMDHSPAEIVLGTPRVDLRVDDMCERLGANINGYVDKMNYKCALAVFEKKKGRTFENPITNHWVKKLWDKYLALKEAVTHPRDPSPPPFQNILADFAENESPPVKIQNLVE